MRLSRANGNRKASPRLDPPDIDIITTSITEPASFVISNAYPNPFNPSTEINIDVPKTGMLNVGVYNLKGQLLSTLINETVIPGSYSIIWDASDLTSGLYIFSVTYGEKSYNQKITLVK